MYTNLRTTDSIGSRSRGANGCHQSLQVWRSMQHSWSCDFTDFIVNFSGQFECGTAKESNMTRAEVEKHFTSKYGEHFGVVSPNYWKIWWKCVLRSFSIFKSIGGIYMY